MWRGAEWEGASKLRGRRDGRYAAKPTLDAGVGVGDIPDGPDRRNVDVQTSSTNIPAPESIKISVPRKTRAGNSKPTREAAPEQHDIATETMHLSTSPSHKTKGTRSMVSMSSSENSGRGVWNRRGYFESNTLTSMKMTSVCEESSVTLAEVADTPKKTRKGRKTHRGGPKPRTWKAKKKAAPFSGKEAIVAEKEDGDGESGHIISVFGDVESLA